MKLKKRQKKEQLHIIIVLLDEHGDSLIPQTAFAHTCI